MIRLFAASFHACFAMMLLCLWLYLAGVWLVWWAYVKVWWALIAWIVGLVRGYPVHVPYRRWQGFTW
ncbi:hypothetical protein [Streptomyces sp. CS014]|uniref:hypothetical protein n=1 Tax=Streptomyces sp. CS014 TaxID=2162707 RepID=UPI000D51899C|nr:hypothetical protein [Streptomyces sp. CS014]PVD04496.1 hypothetical protein DBP12_03460 [Streptomyces sp. CS014]